jgi:ABC-2 type transport system ATP-binding protein
MWRNKNMIEINNISKEYKKNKKVINNLSMKINNGEIFGFLGPNGAGKTTTIKMITGILEVDEGDILIDNYSIKSKPVEAKKNIGLVLDNPDVFLKLKGIEYLNFVADVYDVSEKQRISVIKNLSEIFELKDVLNNKIQSYSHGMKQKLAIISSLLNNPQNWILDEPMTGLDPKSFFELKNLMKEHTKNGNAVFFSTHILDVAEKLCDRVAIIDKGKLLFIGTYQEMKEELRENKSLEELFMEITNNE